MEAPFGLPLEWAEAVQKAKDGEELYRLTKGASGRFALFSAAIDDPNWAEGQGKDFVQKMLEEWKTKETAPAGVATSICTNISHLQPLLPETLELVVDGKVESVFPLLFQAGGGEWFSGLYRSFAINEGKPIPLSGINKTLFLLLKEFFYTGKVESLWKAEVEPIQQLHEFAEKNGLKDLSEYVFRIFKNYLKEETLAGMLTKAMKERSWLFAEELCELINKRFTGATIELEGKGFKVTLGERFPEEVLFFKDHIKVLIAEDAANVPKELMKNLIALKLSGLDTPEQLKGSPPNQLEKLDLSDTLWGWDLIQAWSTHLPNLRTLLMAKTPPIPPDVWPSLENLKSVTEIDLTYQPEPTPVFLDLLRATFPHIEKINI